MPISFRKGARPPKKDHRGNKEPEMAATSRFRLPTFYVIFMQETGYLLPNLLPELTPPEALPCEEYDLQSGVEKRISQGNGVAAFPAHLSLSFFGGIPCSLAYPSLGPRPNL